LLGQIPLFSDDISFIVPGYIGNYTLQLYRLEKIENNQAVLTPFGTVLKFKVKQHSTIRCPKKIRPSIKKLEIMRSLNNLVIRNDPDMNGVKIPEIKKPVWWWQSPEHDRYFLQTIYRLGYEATSFMFTSHECSFFSKNFEEELKVKRKRILQEKKKANTSDYPIVPSDSVLHDHLVDLIKKINC